MNSKEQDVNYKIASMFGEIAPKYDLLNRVLSFGVDLYWRKELVKAIRLISSNRVLDLASGTFDVCKEIFKVHSFAKIIGMDLSLKMMLAGKKKIKRSCFLAVCGDGRRIPLKDSSVDCVTIAFGLRNIYPRDEAYEEVLRVLVDGGMFCILEFGSTKDPILGGIYNIYLSFLLPKIASLLSKHGAYMYLADSVSKFPTAPKLKDELLRAGFKDVSYKRLTFGIVYLYIAIK